MGMQMFNGLPYGGIDPNGIHWSDADKSVKKNLFTYKANSQTINGITFTINSDGSVTVDGTATAFTSKILWVEYASDSFFKQGVAYRATNGNPNARTSDSVEGFGIRLYRTGSPYPFINGFDGESFTIPNEYYSSEANKISITIDVTNGTTVDNQTLYPMVRLASIADDTYAPYIPDNTELMRYTDNAILGAKNLLPNKAVTQEINGVTITVNTDGSVALNGTATTDFGFEYGSMTLGSGNYILSKGSSDSAPNLYLYNYATSSIVASTDSVADHDNVPFMLSAQTTFTPATWIVSGATFNNAVIKPMLRLATDTDNTYVPYAKTNRELTSSTKATTLAVDLTNWTQDTTSQSGSTLYKKQISLNYVSVDCPNVDIGCASGSVLPTTAEQEAYNLIQYVTVDPAVPCLYLYASDIPTTAFYINVIGVD